MGKGDRELDTGGLKAPGADYQILISEEDDGPRGALTRVLEKKGFALTTASSPEEAIAMLDKSDCGPVISDIEIGTEGKRHLIQEMR